VTRAWRLGLFAVFLVPPSWVCAAEQVKIRITLLQPPASYITRNVVQFKEEVESKTGGAISFEIFDSARLYKDTETLEAVASGAVEMADLPLAQFNVKVPALGVIEQPFLFNFDALVRAGTNPDGEFRKLLDAAVLEATGVRTLWWQAFGQSVFFSKGRRTLKTPDLMRGQKIRVFGDNMATFAKYCGGTPMLIAATKQAEALKDGTVDVIMTGISNVVTRELWKVSDTITRTEHAPVEFLVFINEKVWQSLSPEHQAIMTAAARRAEQELRQGMAETEVNAYGLARDKQMIVHELTPDEVADWRACSAGMMEDFMNSSGELGRRLMAAYAKLRTDPCCTAGPKGEFMHR
jgi:C4-dicarboxylate-binding protein DctP